MSDPSSPSDAQAPMPTSDTSDQVFGFQLNGHGSCVFSDGSKYVGEFEDGLFNGQGTHWYADGSRYEGGFSEGHFSGHGVFTSATGTRVEGEFANGIFVGAFDRRTIAQISDDAMATHARAKGPARPFPLLALARRLWVSMPWFSNRQQKAGSEAINKTRQQLNEQLLVEQHRAAEKMADRNYWRNVGDLEMQAVVDITAAIARIPTHLSHSEYQEQLARALEELAAQWRANPDDEDGYGVATVHAIGRTLPSYGG